MRIAIWIVALLYIVPTCLMLFFDSRPVYMVGWVVALTIVAFGVFFMAEYGREDLRIATLEQEQQFQRHDIEKLKEDMRKVKFGML